MSTKETKNLRMRFKSDEGRKFSMSVASVNPALEEEGGADIAQGTVDTLIGKQPFTRVIAECEGGDIVEESVRKVI